VTRALRLMQEVATLPPLGLRLIKRIPAQAGLGGGSSDAAGLLRALRKLLPSTVPDRDFLSVARSVGADVPYFLAGGRALGTGYGDVVSTLPDDEPRWLVISKPDVSCSTPEMYSRLDAFRASGGVWKSGNDFEAVAPAECLNLIESFKQAGLGPVGLCGSGSAVYGFADSRAEAERCSGAIKGGIAVRTLNRLESLAISTA
jgi:4-diphosphocytidyl-2-C-methyl-D-erythritol kinase